MSENGFSRDWCINMAERESNAEIGAGSPDHPLRLPLIDDEDLTRLAERFCSTPLPLTVCADLVAIKPMPGRTGTNLMTVAEAKEMLRAILTPTVTAGLDQAVAQIPAAAFWQVGHDGEGADPSRFKARIFEPMGMDRPAQGWGDTPDEAIRAALATTPARNKSQIGEGA